MAGDGVCAICNETVAAKKMRAHVLGHLEGRGGEGAGLVRVTGGSPIVYWMYVRVGRKASLDDLDTLIRDTWVECCQHLSAFTSKTVSYDSSRFDDGYEGDLKSKSMKANAVRVLSREGSLGYEYDFGTPTSLNVKMVCACPGGGLDEDGVEVVARNADIPHDCGVCGAKGEAAEVCRACLWMDRACLLCKKCAEKHEHGKGEEPVDETSFLPVVNSPRMGMCGYTGDDKAWK